MAGHKFLQQHNNPSIRKFAGPVKTEHNRWKTNSLFLQSKQPPHTKLQYLRFCNANPDWRFGTNRRRLRFGGLWRNSHGHCPHQCRQFNNLQQHNIGVHGNAWGNRRISWFRRPWRNLNRNLPLKFNKQQPLLEHDIKPKRRNGRNRRRL